MGAVPWFYRVPYQADIRRAMLDLREREFRAGRYNPAMPFPDSGRSPGARHRTIDEARIAADADGTRSILDMDDVGTEPYDQGDPQFGVLLPVSPELLEELYGSSRPTAVIMEFMEFLEDVERGTGIYVVLYENDQPSEICFAGCSYD